MQANISVGKERPCTPEKFEYVDSRRSKATNQNCVNTVNCSPGVIIRLASRSHLHDYYDPRFPIACSQHVLRKPFQLHHDLLLPLYSLGKVPWDTFWSVPRSHS